MAETYTYDAFGTLTYIQSLNEDGILTEVETALSRFLYAGEQYDEVAGLYYLRARRYDTTVGRFTQEDTYLGDGRNLYVYVQNNPLKYVDPSGYCSKSSGYTYMYNELFPAPWEPNFIYAGQIQEEDSILKKIWDAKVELDIAEGDYNQGTADAILDNVSNGLWSEYGVVDATIKYDLPYIAGRVRGEALVTIAEVYATLQAGAATITAGATTAALTTTGQVIPAAGVATLTVEGTIVTSALFAMSANSANRTGEAAGDLIDEIADKFIDTTRVKKQGGIPVKEKTKTENGLYYQSNPKHTPGHVGFNASAGVEPKNSLELFENSVESSIKANHRYTFDSDTNTLHRFFSDGNGTWHWSGSTNQGINSLTSAQIPSDIKKMFNLSKKGW